MSQKPETLLWNRIKSKIPPHWNITRIENRYGGGVPDVHICAESIPFWVELKTTKTNAINISSHQIAWNYAYCKSGGVSFYLLHPLSSPHLYLFDGVHGRELVKSGLRGVDTGSGSGVKPLWSGDSESGVVVGMLEIARSRVGGQVGSGAKSGARSGRGSWSEEVGSGSGSGVKESWPGPGV